MAQERIGRYTILEEIASGTQGAVHRAFDPESGQIVAVKILHPGLSSDRSYLERFHREATITSSIDHPNVVGIREVGESGGRHFIAMEFLPESLGRLIESAGRLPVPSSVSFAVQIADGLAAAHARGVVHRDVKPQNVLIAADGTAKVTDFGIARGESLATMTATGMVMGTPYYMSPEQCLGERADARSDIYSLGCVLYQMLTGALPFEASTPLAVLRKHTDEPPRPLREVRDDIPQPVADIVARALAKEPEERFGTAIEMAGALRRVPVSVREGPPVAQASEDQLEREIEAARRGRVAQVPPPPPIRGTGTVCADCGAPWRPGGRYCTRCGSPNFKEGVRSSTAATYDRSRPEADRERLAGYRSPATRAAWAKVLLGICAILTVASIFSTWAEISLLQNHRMTAWPYPSTEEITSNDTRQAWIGFLYLAGYAGSVIAFCVWIHGAAKNLRPLGVYDQRFSPAWSVGWWFVPIMNIFRSYQVMSEIWRRSDPDIAPGDSGSTPYVPDSSLMGWWWGLWMMSGWVGIFVSRMFQSRSAANMFGGRAVDQFIAADWVSMAGGGLTLLAAVLAFLLVSQITKRQEEEHKVLSLALT